ncbi:MotA/TolQ/ExbB proton channel family protein [Petroclostridium sp. X23]|uniref:motility protein A n=1 Tax=Petroclostridium sp. X23 TaxID=3045146 RepID=UPI0024AE6DB6|nr:MotA/TolQ/ExbB proton channel family protein [Petroclostridium sp. X23]WHH59357.1 MotA/TolQ/ExbB proton channel family protein [Petroclostridium sp. X23]
MNFTNRNTKLIVIGILAVLLLHAILGSIPIKAVFNLAALEIIFAGICLAAIISFPFSTVMDTVIIIKESFQHQIAYEDAIYKIHKLAIKIKREGVLSIKQEIDMEKDIFLRDAMVLLNDYKKPDNIQDILSKDIETRRANFQKPYNVLKMMAQVAPSFGLIGTLIGLIGLLSNIDQPRLIMGNMAAALVSTLYGSLIANFVAIPLMGRLKEYTDSHILRYTIITEGIVLIAREETSRDIFDKMNVMLKEEQRLQYPRKFPNEGM